MKKLTILTYAVIFAITITSCSKQAPQVSATRNLAGSAESPENQSWLISNWSSLNFYEIQNEVGNYSLEGRQEFNSYARYNRNNYMELAYLMINGSSNSVYYKLPIVLPVEQDGNQEYYSFDYRVDGFGLVFSIRNVAKSLLKPDKSGVINYQFRYIIIPKSLYENLKINWIDFSEVAKALNI
jgi:hypothetical protein